MKRIPISLFIAIAITALSYFVNNRGECCDQIFQAGWPFPYYGGSGGFIGIQEDKLIMTGLILDIVFWFVISMILIYVFTYKKNLFRK